MENEKNNNSPSSSQSPNNETFSRHSIKNSHHNHSQYYTWEDAGEKVGLLDIINKK